MLVNNKILVGKNEENEACILLDKANRHGLITGASGSGKTITLKVLAESFSDAGVPVFLVDVKGDLAGMALSGEMNENIEKRINKLKLNDFNVKSYPTTFFDVYGKHGHSVRMPMNSMSTRVLAKLLNLTSTQEGVLAIVFKIAEDENLPLVTIDDLRNLLNYVGEKRNEYTLNYGNITTQSIGAIQRSLLAFAEEDGDILFGLPSIDVKDFIHFDSNTGQGQINILDATELFNHPTLYATVVLSILNNLYNTMPEIGDAEKPKLVFFFDEAHLVFSEMSDIVIKQLIQIVKLIRSKGIGLYFISQSPGDIPDEILAQLGNRVQHVLRSYTKTDEKVIKAAANSYRDNPKFNTIEEIKSLGTGEALISFLNENGEPSIVDHYTVLPPQSKMGTIDDSIRNDLIKKSHLYNKYLEVKTTAPKVSSSNTSQSGMKQQVSMSMWEKPNTPKETVEESKKTTTKKTDAQKKASRIEKKIQTRVENKLINKFVNKIFK